MSASTELKIQEGPFQLAGNTYATGKHRCRIPVTRDLNDAEIALHAHVVVGAKPGPTLTLTSTLHGVEWLSIEMIRRAVAAIDPQELSGAVIGLPVVNPPALGALSRCMPDDSDSPDLNRIFPGGQAWTSDQIAETVTREILPHTSALIDFHLGIWGSSFGYVAYGSDFPDQQVTETSRRMAEAFDFEMICAEKIVAKFPGARSMCGYAGSTLGIPSCIGELGGSGFDHDREQAWIDTTVTGILNVMRKFGMLPGANPPRRRHLEFAAKVRVNPRFGGILYPVREREELGREVTEGELLAQVISPYTFEVLEELRAPFDGYLAWISRWYPVRPGDWAFGVIPKHDPGTRWVEAEGSM
mgnify:CR=1 FL=1